MNYASLADRVEKLIAKYGRSLTLRNYGAAVYNPVTMTYTPGTAVDVSVSGVQRSYKAYEIDGTNIKAGDARFIVASQIEPTTAMKLVVDGIEWVIVSVQPLQPASIALYYVVQARKA